MRGAVALGLVLSLTACGDPGGEPPDAASGRLDAASALDADTRLDAGPLDAARPPGVDAAIDPATDAALGELIVPDDPGPADVRIELSAARRHAISPWIYGSNQVDPDALHGETIGRHGGNRWTAYNWETNASNAGSDYLYQNDAYLGGGSTPGGAVLERVSALHERGLAALVTVPIAGYVAADTRGPTDSGGADRATRFFELRASGGTLGRAPDTGDRVVYADEFVDWIRRTLMPTGRVFFSLDNEPDLWSETHSEIHPDPVRYDELIRRNTEFATAITAIVPDAIVFGPVNYGYAGYVNLQDAPDAAGRDFLDTYLEGMRSAEASAGRRLVHALDVHWYPEARGGGGRITDEDTSPARVEARVQAPRSLWDPSYVESSWITDCCSEGAIRLLPRLAEKIAAHYPGTGIAITEYNYGGADHISGAIAQADVLGIFADEGVFAAMWWQLSSARRFVDAAFEMYRDFDGAGASFGDTAIASSSSDIERVAVHASIDAAHPERVVVVLVNRAATSVRAGLRIEHDRRLGRSRVFTLEGSTPTPRAGAEIVITATNAFVATLPARSVTTLELAP